MKKILLAISVLCLSISSFAAEDTIGLGFILGNPTGISGNYKFEPNRSMDLALAYDTDEDDEFYLHSTYLLRFPNLQDLDKASLGWYAGVGGRFIWEDRRRDDELRLGVRGSAGLSLEFKAVPIEIFAEIAPVLDIIESTDFDLDGGIGARYYF